ncbi:RHS repeat-associated core domain-containing protein [Pseudomonas viridiflava]|uniref:RHS repeat-associated core domain-containing protein n=1 Tax=Pseudomonas viridiflava TaxID=33069 RepID=A0ABU7N1X3_PSEVI|nr:RHS repeat-associated core domain-containing protein [Pseudomonas viridiflava]MEE4038922.1 RHS repeat-associated core domain-containing protein [Pseudomonas viridiflava]MEE4058984.1 RHS repeat-associated core domain-containing protein [Pseudomonas viridiflava]MEE4167851.1 RHS repeat-associated core domain-containing protein [Pseudomonas viridiflava]
MNGTLHQHTPALDAFDCRGLRVRHVSLHRAQATDEAVARITAQRFNLAGQMIAALDPRLGGAAQAANSTHVFSLTGQTLLTDSVDAGWRLVLFGEAGQLLNSWDGRGLEQQGDYDDLLRPTAITEQGRVVERFSYGAADAFEHNQCNQIIRHDDPAGSSFVTDYGVSGAVLDEARSFLLEPVSPDWPLAEPGRDALLESDRLHTRRAVNALGEVLQQTDVCGNVQQFHQTVAGQLKSMELTHSGVTQTLVSDLRYNAFNQVEQETAGNGVISCYTYEAQTGRLNELLANSADGGALQHLKYAYDPVGNVLEIEDAAQPIRFFSNQRIEPVRRYTYDTLYQLIEATGFEVRTGASHGPALPDLNLPPDPNQLSNYTQTYDYDAAGNLLTMHHVGEQNFTRTMRVAPDSNRSLPEGEVDTDFVDSFDANGNLLQLVRGQSLSWDARNQLQQITTVQRETGLNDEERYVYDGQGQRVRKLNSAQASGRKLINEVRYLPGLEIRTTADGEILHVITAQAGRNGVRVLHWEAGKPNGIANDQVRYSLTDHLGSSALELDQQSGLISQESYYPFGGTAWWAARSVVEAKYKTVRYSGKERDASGLYYYGLRYYAPWLQRWINPDPAGDVDGLNLFSFVKNSPVGHIDPAGSVSTPYQDAYNAYDLMFKQGRVWEGLSQGAESGIETMARISKRNLSTLSSEIDSEIDSEQHRRVADRIAGIAPKDYWLVHFGRQDFSTQEGIHFKTLVTLQKERGDLLYEGNSMGGNIPNYGNHDFSFFSLETGGSEPAKTRSRFGDIRFHTTLSALGDKFSYAHMEATDLLRHNTREISPEHAKSLKYLKTIDTGEGFHDFKHRVGLREDKESDLLFYGEDMLPGLGHKIAADLSGLPIPLQETVVEWTRGDRPLENVSQVINSFYRPQIAVPGGLMLKKGQYSSRKPDHYPGSI